MNRFLGALVLPLLFFLLNVKSVSAQEKKNKIQTNISKSLKGFSIQGLYRIDSGSERYILKSSYGADIKYSYSVFKSISPSIGIETQFMSGFEDDNNSSDKNKIHLDLYQLNLGLTFHLVKSSKFEMDLDLEYLITKGELEQYYNNEWRKGSHNGKGVGLGLNTGIVLNSFSNINFGFYTRGRVTRLEESARSGSGYIDQYYGLVSELRIGYSYKF